MEAASQRMLSCYVPSQVITVHPDHHLGSPADDAAVLTLTAPVELSESVAAVCLASNAPLQGSLCFTTAWEDPPRGIVFAPRPSAAGLLIS